MGRILVVDDEEGIRMSLEVLFSIEHVVFTAPTVEEARAVIGSEELDLVITDLRLEPDGNGIDVIRAARERTNPPEVILMTAYGTREKAQEAVREGASFYVEKGTHLTKDLKLLCAQAIQKRRLHEENLQLRRALLDRNSPSGIIGKSEVMQEVLDLVERFANGKTTVLICGESGTGKERIAKALHYSGDRANGPLVTLNCGALPENLIESELFGYVKGAFTGADSDKTGLIEGANAGTLFLDEIGELPMILQPKLLRVLQDKVVRRIGAHREEPVNVRFVAATNRDLESEVEAGRFREDLYYRLKVVQIDLPPLRQRREDIPPLVSTFLDKFSAELGPGREVREVSAEAMERLLNFHYPGNVRQLENLIERAVALATGGVVLPAQLPKEVLSADSVPTRVFKIESSEEPFPEEGVDLERMVEDFEYGLISKALEKADGVKTKAAELLGLSFRQFRYKLNKLNKHKKSRSSSSA